ncbi:MAG: DUF3822 family protein [Catalinimonas sp.]
MSAPATTPRLLRKIKDERFDVERLSAYGLYLHFGATWFRFCVIDTTDGRCLWLEHHVLDGPGPDALEHIFDQHQVLKAGYWHHVRAATADGAFTLVPPEYFDPERPEVYLRSLLTLREGGSVHHHRGDADFVTVFEMERRLHEWLTGIYPMQAVEHRHVVTSWLAGVRRDLDEGSHRTAYLLVESDHFTTLVYRAGQLEFCNAYGFGSETDFLYFVMLVVSETGFDPEQDALRVWGEVTPDANVYRKLRKYVRNVSLGPRPAGLTFFHGFDEVSDHRYYDLFALHYAP